ncbi:unnamed protein product [Penicillium salamii]|uniref:Protein FYV10 n=1 Tax=Penicillium salamii TaxID=1612424 RepID=A0A9W4IN96_9EURO|nr:unnamed protein product [Penicillium salamii]
MSDVPFPPSGGARAPTSYPSISSIPRRSSYASVVSGNAFSPSFSNLLTESLPSSTFDRVHRAPFGVDADMQMNSAWRPDSLPPHSRKYAGFLQSDVPHPGLLDPPFLTPSYLRNSRYLARLETAHRAKLTRDSNPPLSASPSNAHLPRIAPSHRGMTYDIIEKEPPTKDSLSPLPSQWSSADKYAGLELSNDSFDVRYTGPVHKHDHEAAALRADHPMPPQCGIYYFEVKIESKPKEGMIGIGFSSPKASVERLPGWEQESWAYHGDDGKSFFGESQGQGRAYGPTFTVGDTVGCGVNFSTGSAFFTKNGIFLGMSRGLGNESQLTGSGNAFHELRNVKLYPSVGMKKLPPVHLKANFGQEPFVFDIDSMVRVCVGCFPWMKSANFQQQERVAIQYEINATPTTNLQPPLDESTLLQELVAQFLAHDGYVETARAFAGEVASETLALQNGRNEPLKKYEVEEDHEAINRNKIRSAILDGDIDKALKHTKAYYANVLEANPQIHFKLRCRKFLEMMRHSNEISTRPPSAHSHEHAVFDHEMELDDDTDGSFNQLLTEAVQYGQQLRADYPNDENGGDKKLLDDIFSLVAYPDPKRSVHGHYLETKGRVAVAEELNSAILVSLGKSSAAALERLYQQTEVLVNEISEDGGAGAFINVQNDVLL